MNKYDRNTLQKRVDAKMDELAKEIAEELIADYPNVHFDIGMGCIDLRNNRGSVVHRAVSLNLWKAQFGSHPLVVTLNIEHYLEMLVPDKIK